MAFWSATRPEFEDYGDSVRETLVAVLCSPHFLFLVEEPGAVTGDELPMLAGEALATRLSYFLWNSPPDAELLQLASEGLLADDELAAQSRGCSTIREAIAWCAPSCPSGCASTGSTT